MKKILELLLCILHPVAVVLIWINLALRSDLGLLAKLTWAIAVIVPFVPFVYVLTGNDFIYLTAAGLVREAAPGTSSLGCLPTCRWRNPQLSTDPPRRRRLDLAVPWHVVRSPGAGFSQRGHHLEGS
jgi:hypothetical protein